MTTDKLPDEFPGSTVDFGKYQLLGQIGKGGMADVYLGRQRGQRRLVAIKCMKANLAKRKSFVDMFIREGKLAVQLNHDAIVKSHEIGRIEGTYFICMEYISGVDLSLLIRRCRAGLARRLPVPHALHIALRICEGLHYAHELKDETGRSLNIVNRDVSPANVRVSFHGDVKLLDFGIAKDASGLSSEIGVLKGKISHMSPEQVRGLPLDRRSDVFSAAIVLHEMLTGDKLFRGDSEFAVMDLVRQAEVPPPSLANPRVPQEVDALVLKGLQKAPAERYQSAEEMAEALRQAIGRYNFVKTELRDLVRDVCRDEWTRERMVVDTALATQTLDMRPAPAKVDYGEFQVSFEEEVRSLTQSVPTIPKPKQPWWLWALLGFSVVLLAVAAVVLIRGKT